MTGKQKARLAARCLEEKKASDIVLLELSTITHISDYFVIATCESKRQIKACAEYVDEILSARGVTPHHIEGILNIEWVLMDYGDIIIHIFIKDARLYYGLERLWGDAPKIDYKVGRKSHNHHINETEKGESSG